MKQQSHRREKVLLICAGAVVALIAILMLFVLPSEFGIDPTGFGRATGLTKISAPAGSSAELQRGAKRTGVLKLDDGAMLATASGRKDHWESGIGPYEWVEFKYTLREGETFAFNWQTTEPVRFDMHAHPFEGGTALTESYGVGHSDRMLGTYTAPFTGIHGWYWQNRTLKPVRVTLDAIGPMTASTIFDTDGEHRRPLGDGN